MKASDQPSRREVIKHSAAIQIEGTITLPQRRVWNVLLAQACDTFLSEDVYHISLKHLATLLDYHSHDEAYLKAALRALVDCRVSWNILEKDGSEEWGVTSLLASVVIKKGLCSYAYSPPLRQRLHHPRMYARLDLHLQNQFSRKYAQALWELCTDYLGTGRAYGETPFITLDQFRKLMGVEAHASTQHFKILRRDVLKPALAELHQVAQLQVTVAQRLQGRHIVALKFKIRRLQRESASLQQEPDTTLAALPAVVRLLTDAGLAYSDALAMWQAGFDYIEADKRPPASGEDLTVAFGRYVQEKIHLLKQRVQTGTVKHPAGFLLTALKKNYANPQMEQAARQQRRTQQGEAQQQLTREKEHITHARDQALQDVSTQLITTQPELLPEAVAALQAQKDAVFAFCYESDKTALDNYRAHALVAGAISRWLEKRFPQPFEDAKKPFMDRLAALEPSFGTLEGRPVSDPE